MPFPRHLLQAQTFRSEPYMAAMAAVAVGMFIGAWVLGPAITHEPESQPASEEQQTAQQEPLTYQAMLSRPDPSPYRTPTPDYGSYGAPNYGQVAKERAQAGLGSESAPVTEPPRYRSSSSRYYRPFDRHAIH